MLKKIKPSSSYEIDLPDSIREDYDERVSSFWMEGNPLALQLSSYIRHDDNQISALERLNHRIKSEPHSWKQWKRLIHPDPAVDQASAEFIDQEGFIWIHSYLVWPHLTIYATISGPSTQLADEENWALQSLKSVRLAMH